MIGSSFEITHAHLTTTILKKQNFLPSLMAEQRKKKADHRPKKDDPTVHAKEEDDVYPAEEQGIMAEETSEQKEQAMEHGDEDEDIYSEEGRDKLEEDDEIDPWEEGFMAGASQAGQLGKDALTGEPLMDVDKVVESVIDGKMYRFVNKKNAQQFGEKKRKEKRK